MHLHIGTLACECANVFIAESHMPRRLSTAIDGINMERRLGVTTPTAAV